MTFTLGQVLTGYLSRFILEQDGEDLIATGSTTKPVKAVYLGEAPNNKIYTAILLEDQEPWVEVLSEVIPGQWHSTENDCEFYLAVST